jgi:5'-nucleotidase
MKKHVSPLLLIVLLLAGLSLQGQPVKLTVVQLNDVYEITPVQGGQAGGFARVATLVKQLKAQSPRDCVLVVLAGDFLSPSLYNSVEVNGQRIAGQQMVEAMDALGVRWVTFGNHEFDLTEADLQARIDHSKFGWIASNTFHRTRQGTVEPFRQRGQPLPRYAIWTIDGPKGQRLRLGVLGLTLPYNHQPYVYYADPLRTADSLVRVLTPQTDALIALTHQNIGEDLELARRQPRLRLLIGGHEHTADYHRLGKQAVAKADANARTVYVHRLTYKPKSKKLTFTSELVPVGPHLASDPQVEQVVGHWTEQLYSALRTQGWQPEETIAHAAAPLDGLEAHVRSRPTNLGRHIARSLAEVVGCEAALYNSGSVRVDDELSGPITQVDVLRTLPFGGGAVELHLRGAALQRILAAGEANRGSGGYLQTWGIEGDSTSGWRIGGQAIDPQALYRIATTQYVSRGLEKNLEFVREGGPGIERVHQPASWPDGTRNDVRWVLIRYLKALREPLR